MNDFVFYKLFQLFTIFVSTGVGMVSAQSCIAMPIAISDATLCSNNNCYITQLANVAIPLQKGASSCLKFTSPDKNILPFTVNITAINTYVQFRSDYCYFTDTVVAQSKGFCGCPSGTPTSCSNCPNSAVIGDDPVCTSGNHNDQSCFGTWFGESGTYCLKTAFSGFNRYKVCKMKTTFDYTVDFLVKASNLNRTFSIDYDGLPVAYNHEAAFVNISIQSLSAQINYRPEFLVLDLHTPNNVYSLGSDLVNGLTEFNMKKIGYYKSGQTVKMPASVGNEIIATIADCTNNQFNVIYPWIDVSTILTNSVDNLITAVAPGSVYIDQDTSSFVGLSGHVIPDHSDGLIDSVANGIIYYESSTGSPVARGLDYDNQLIASQMLTMTNFYNGTITVTTNTQCECSSTPTGTAGFIFCKGSTCNTTTTDFWCNALYTPPFSCRNGTAFAISLRTYPTNKIGSFWVENGALKKTLGGTDPTVELLSNIGNGVANLQVQFKNFTIQFEHTTVSPKIKNLVQDGSNLIVTALSLTNPGNCYISSSPAGLIHLNPISLFLTSNDYKYPLALNANSTFAIQIRCYENIDSMSINVSPFEGSIDLPENKTVSVRNPVDYFFSPGHLVGDLDDAFDSNPITHWANTLIAIAFWILIAVTGILIIVAILKFVVPWSIKSRMMKRFKNRTTGYMKTN